VLEFDARLYHSHLGWGVGGHPLARRSVCEGGCLSQDGLAMASLPH